MKFKKKACKQKVILLSAVQEKSHKLSKVIIRTADKTVKIKTLEHPVQTEIIYGTRRKVETEAE